MFSLFWAIFNRFSIDVFFAIFRHILADVKPIVSWIVSQFLAEEICIDKIKARELTLTTDGGWLQKPFVAPESQTLFPPLFPYFFLWRQQESEVSKRGWRTAEGVGARRSFLCILFPIPPLGEGGHNSGEKRCSAFWGPLSCQPPPANP